MKGITLILLGLSIVLFSGLLVYDNQLKEINMNDKQIVTNMVTEIQNKKDLVFCEALLKIDFGSLTTPQKDIANRMRHECQDIQEFRKQYKK